MNADELDQQHARAQALSRKWGRREDVAFWLCTVSSVAFVSDRPWLHAIAAAAALAWVLTLVMHTRSIRAEHHWWTRWATAFYREHKP